MSDTRPVPTNLDSWPGVIDLVVTYKHLLHVLWSSPSGLMSIIGVGRAGIIEHLTGATRLDEPVVLEALRELHRRRLVAIDEETREVAVRRWCRFHTFGGKWAAQAQSAYSKIESATIKGILAQQEGVNELFPVKSKPPAPTAVATASAPTTTAADAVAVASSESPLPPSAFAAAPARKKMTVHYGIQCWSADDIATAEQMVVTTPLDELAAAIAAAMAANKAPVPGTVATFLRVIAKTKATTLAVARHTAEKATQDALHPLPPPLTAEALAKLPAAAQRIDKMIRSSKNQGATA